jgi:serine/threonine protein kinase
MRVCPRCRSIYSMPVDRCGIDGTPVVETELDPLVGTRLDRYDVLELLGQGAMGCVYRARHNVLASEYAIKVLYGNLALNHRLIERFRREAQAIGQMKHPNIVEVADFGQTAEGLTFLVMQLVAGRTLEDALAEDSADFPAERIARIARQIASGLGEAHRRGFVHRDMKPANVMLADMDGLEVVKILDFGVVGLIQQAAMQRLTIAGHIVGTPNYMAPEQARTSTVGPAADLYALGVIVYEMLAGRPPFEGLGVAEVLLKQINEPPPPLRPEVNPGLAKLTRWLLEKKPEDRPAHAARVIAEIDRLNLDVASTEQILVSAVKRSLPRPVIAPPPDAETESHSLERIRELRGSHDEEITGDLSPPVGSPIPLKPLVPEGDAATGIDPTVISMPVVGAPTQPIEVPPLEAPPIPDAITPSALLAPPLLGPLRVAPSIIRPDTTSKDGEVEPLRASEADGPTQLDLVAANRPRIDLAKAQEDLVQSSSNADTAPPEEHDDTESPCIVPDPRSDGAAARSNEDIGTVRDVDTDPAELSKGDVLHADTFPTGARRVGGDPREDGESPLMATIPIAIPIAANTAAKSVNSTRRLFWLVVFLAVGCGLVVAAILKRI